MLIGVIPPVGIGVFATDGVKYLEYNTETCKFDELVEGYSLRTPISDKPTTNRDIRRHK